MALLIRKLAALPVQCFQQKILGRFLLCAQHDITVRGEREVERGRKREGEGGKRERDREKGKSMYMYERNEFFAFFARIIAYEKR